VYLLSGLKTDFKFLPNGTPNGTIVPSMKYSAKISEPILTTDPYASVANLYEPDCNLPNMIII